MGFWQALSLGLLAGMVALLLVTLVETVDEVRRPEPEYFPDLDEVTKWRLHREARQILDEVNPDAV